MSELSITISNQCLLSHNNHCLNAIIIVINVTYTTLGKVDSEFDYSPLQGRHIKETNDTHNRSKQSRLKIKTHHMNMIQQRVRHKEESLE